MPMQVPEHNMRRTAVPSNTIPLQIIRPQPVVAENLNFRDVRAVRAAHARLAQAPALGRLCEQAFDDRDRDSIRGALATLILCQCAAQRQQRADALHGNRHDAFTTLAAHLTPTGHVELLHTLGAHAHDQRNLLSDVLSEANRWGLAGHVDLRQAKTEGEAADGADGHAQVAQTYVKAAWALGKAGLHEQAAQSYTQAAEAHTRATAYHLAAMAHHAEAPTQATRYQQLAGMVHHAEAPTQATGYEVVAIAHWSAADAYKRAGLLEQAAHARSAVAVTYMVAELPSQARRAWEQAAHAWWAVAYACVEPHRIVPDAAAGTAARVYRWAAELHQQAKQPEQQAQALLSAADAGLQAGRPDASAEACEKAARAFARAALPERAGDAFLRAADLHLHRSGLAGEFAAPCADERAANADTQAVPYAQAERAGQAADAWRQAGYAYLQAGLHGPAADAFTSAAKACQCAGARTRADAAAHEADAVAHLAAGRVEQAAEAFERAAAAYRDAHAYRDAVEADWSAGARFMAVGRHGCAVRAFTGAAHALTKDKRHYQAGAAWERVAHACATPGGQRAAGEKTLASAQAAYQLAGQPDRPLQQYWSA